MKNILTNILTKKKSPIHGYGIFAKKDIRRGEAFYVVPVKTVSLENKHRWAYIGKGRYVCDRKVLNWVNHSCQPNAIFSIKDDPPMLIAKRKIAAGEEITCDYKRTEVEKLKFKCHCNMCYSK